MAKWYVFKHFVSGVHTYSAHNLKKNAEKARRALNRKGHKNVRIKKLKL